MAFGSLPVWEMLSVLCYVNTAVSFVPDSWITYAVSNRPT